VGSAIAAGRFVFVHAPVGFGFVVVQQRVRLPHDEQQSGVPLHQRGRVELVLFVVLDQSRRVRKHRRVEQQLSERVMKQLTIVVKPFRAEAVLRAIAELGVTACAVREAKGYGRQKGYLDRYRGSEYSTAYLPKVEITVWVTDEQAAELRDAAPKVARTGRIGDGKVFVVPVAWDEPLEF
jgi:nitrogen regulatory protein P-II 2